MLFTVARRLTADKGVMGHLVVNSLVDDSTGTHGPKPLRAVHAFRPQPERPVVVAIYVLPLGVGFTPHILEVLTVLGYALRCRLRFLV